jgi:hypothetical protein
MTAASSLAYTSAFLGPSAFAKSSCSLLALHDGFPSAPVLISGKETAAYAIKSSNSGTDVSTCERDSDSGSHSIGSRSTLSCHDRLPLAASVGHDGYVYVWDIQESFLLGSGTAAYASEAEAQAQAETTDGADMEHTKSSEMRFRVRFGPDEGVRFPYRLVAWASLTIDDAMGSSHSAPMIICAGDKGVDVFCHRNHIHDAGADGFGATEDWALIESCGLPPVRGSDIALWKEQHQQQQQHPQQHHQLQWLQKSMNSSPETLLCLHVLPLPSSPAPDDGVNASGSKSSVPVNHAIVLVTSVRAIMWSLAMHAAHVPHTNMDDSMQETDNDAGAGVDGVEEWVAESKAAPPMFQSINLLYSIDLTASARSKTGKAAEAFGQDNTADNTAVESVKGGTCSQATAADSVLHCSGEVGGAQHSTVRQNTFGRG